ncbi:MAG: methyltransferase domain-containing protein [Candidatus Hodarchaeota archaeon]
MSFLRETRDLFTYNTRYIGRLAKHDHFNVFQKTLRDLKLAGFRRLREKNVLDLGCGQRYSFGLQCAAEGGNVTALDIDYVKPDMLALYFIRCFKYNNFKRAVKSTFRRILFDRRYYKALELYAGKPVYSFSPRIKFVTADQKKSNYPLPSGTFDLIVSNAVLEHVSDVSGFASEVRRLLRQGGYFYGYIHNFYSISGGHNLEWAFPDENPSEKVPPWDHLRGNKYPAHVYLNQYRPEQFQQAFAKHLRIRLFEERDINHDSNGKEGVRFLTGQVARELTEYPRRLLLTRAYCLICQKTPSKSL